MGFLEVIANPGEVDRVGEFQRRPSEVNRSRGAGDAVGCPRLSFLHLLLDYRRTANPRGRRRTAGMGLAKWSSCAAMSRRCEWRERVHR